MPSISWFAVLSQGFHPRTSLNANLLLEFSHNLITYDVVRGTMRGRQTNAPLRYQAQVPQGEVDLRWPDKSNSVWEMGFWIEWLSWRFCFSGGGVIGLRLGDIFDGSCSQFIAEWNEVFWDMGVWGMFLNSTGTNSYVGHLITSVPSHNYLELCWPALLIQFLYWKGKYIMPSWLHPRKAFESYCGLHKWLATLRSYRSLGNWEENECWEVTMGKKSSLLGRKAPIFFPLFVPQ